MNPKKRRPAYFAAERGPCGGVAGAVVRAAAAVAAVGRTVGVGSVGRRGGGSVWVKGS